MLNIDEDEKIIQIIIKPYKILSKVLGILLFVSICGNIYLSVKKVDITLIANDNEQSNIKQTSE